MTKDIQTRKDAAKKMLEKKLRFFLSKLEWNGHARNEWYLSMQFNAKQFIVHCNNCQDCARHKLVFVGAHPSFSLAPFFFRFILSYPAFPYRHKIDGAHKPQRLGPLVLLRKTFAWATIASHSSFYFYQRVTICQRPSNCLTRFFYF